MGELNDRDELFAVASTQHGYFTAAQARACGYSHALLAYHVRGGRVRRVRRGLYRFREYPSSPREEVMVAWLAAGPGCAVVSHESALDLLDLADVIPGAVHLTVPRARRHLSASPGVALHTSVSPPRPEETVVRDGVRATDAMRTILDVAEVGTAPEQVVRAVGEALRRGWRDEAELHRQADRRGRRVAGLEAEALVAAGREAEGP